MPGIVADVWKSHAEQWVPAILDRATEITSADAAYEWLRTNEHYIPREYVREVWKEYVAGDPWRSVIDRMTDVSLIPRALHTEIHWAITEPYRYIIRIEGVFDGETEILSRYVTVDSDRQMTAGELRDLAILMGDSAGMTVYTPDFGIHIDRAYHVAGRAW